MGFIRSVVYGTVKDFIGDKIRDILALLGGQPVRHDFVEYVGREVCEALMGWFGHGNDNQLPEIEVITRMPMQFVSKLLAKNHLFTRSSLRLSSIGPSEHSDKNPSSSFNDCRITPVSNAHWRGRKWTVSLGISDIVKFDRKKDLEKPPTDRIARLSKVESDGVVGLF